MTEALAPAWDSLRQQVKIRLERRAPRDLADDVTQEVMLSLLQHLGQISDEAHLDRWLHTVASNRLVSEHRRRASRLRVETGAAEPPAATGLAEPEALNEIVGSWLIQQIDELPEPYAQALIEVDLGGKSQVDFAKKHGLSQSGARTRVQRARRLLLEHLESSCDTSRDARGNIIRCEPRGNCCPDSR